MRNLLLVLLLAGCSTEPLLIEPQAMQADAEKIHQAELLCMKNQNIKDADEFNVCLDAVLKDNQSAKNKVAERAARAKNWPSTGGMSDMDRMCERYGHALGTAEYDACIEYAKENPAGLKESEALKGSASH